MKDDNNATNLLDCVYKNVRMASFAIDCIIDKIENPSLDTLLRKQNDFYLDTTEILENIAKTLNYEPKDINPLLKGSSFASINMKTVFNHETSHLAEMLVQGTTMGITDTIKSISEFPCNHKQLLETANSVVACEEKFVESLKDFL